MIRSCYNFVDFDTFFFIGSLGVGSSNIPLRKKSGIGASCSHSSINTVKSDVSSIFGSSSSEGDNEMSSSSDAVVAVNMRGHGAAYQTKNASSRLSKIPVPGAAGPPGKDGLRRVNSMRNTRSAPSSGYSTPVPTEHDKVVYRDKSGRLTAGNNGDATKNRLSLNEQTFRSLPSSANTSPSNKRRNTSLSSASSNSLTTTAGAGKTQRNSANKKAQTNRIALCKTSSASTPEEIRKAREKEKPTDVFRRLTKLSGNKQNTGAQKGIPVSSSRSHSQCSSRSHSQCSSRSESPNEYNAYTTGTRRSTMPSKATPKQVTKETNALAKLASKITQWAQRTQNEPETKPPIKPQQTKSSAKSYKGIPVRKTPSPYDRTVTAPVRRSSLRLKGSRSSISSTGSVSPIDPHPMPAGDVTANAYLDREGENPFSDTETPLVPTSPLTINTTGARGNDSSSLECGAANVESSSSYDSNTGTPMTVIKKTKDANQHSPYFIRMSTGSSNKATGELDQLIGELNLEEIEGAVSIEADEYRRMAQEVKALKTVLLKLKRELQADVSC